MAVGAIIAVVLLSRRTDTISGDAPDINQQAEEAGLDLDEYR